MEEYIKIKDYTYLDYCNYLQNKYGIGLANYMSENYVPTKKCKRTKDGLIAHHKAEDRAILLSSPCHAMNSPFEWQLKENIVYCDLLEHLMLHVLICYYPSPEKDPEVEVGYRGVICFIAPELNDVYSGFKTTQEWRKNLHDKIINDKDVYFKIMKQFVEYAKKGNDIKPSDLHNSMNGYSGLWDESKNNAIYCELDKLWF